MNLNGDIIDLGNGFYQCNGVKIKQDNMKDAERAFTIVDHGDGTYTRGGVTIEQENSEKALNTFQGMAPEGWIDPLTEIQND